MVLDAGWYLRYMRFQVRRIGTLTGYAHGDRSTSHIPRILPEVYS